MTKTKSAKKPVEVKEKTPPEEKLEVVPVVEQPIVPADFRHKLTRQQVELVKNTVAKGASDDELKLFLYVCARSGLDPFTKQVHLIPRWDTKLGKETRTIQVGIDGLRSVAERSGNYAGNDDPVFDDEEKPKKATVTVHKVVQGQRVPFTASARWAQYYPGDKMGFMWNKMPHLMIGKCAEALALRKAFPSVMTGLYIPEEMHHASKAGEAGIEPPVDKFKQATEAIGKDTNPARLEKFLERIKQAPDSSYTPAQKKTLIDAITKRINHLLEKADVETVQTT